MTDHLEQKFLDAYRNTQHRHIIDVLRCRGVPQSELDSNAERILAAAARTGAADLRNRLPAELRKAYLDRRHWRMGGQAANVDELVRASYDSCIARLTEDDIVDALPNRRLLE